jgi:hypothetical protein
MKKEQFITALMEMIPACKPETAEMWSEFASERVEAEQYVDFTKNPDGDDASIEDWLDTIYAGIGLVKQRFNEEIALQILNLDAVPFCLYPYEMCAAAKHFENGGKPEDIPELNEKGWLDSLEEDNWPMFPKPELLSDHTGGEESPGITMQ